MRKNIEKLIFESGESMYKISMETGIAQSTLSDFKKGKTTLDTMKFINAEKLNEYYLKNFK